MSDALTRLPTQKEKILRRLKMGPARNYELNGIAFRYSARIHELRAEGHEIRVASARKLPGVFIYHLTNVCPCLSCWTERAQPDPLDESDHRDRLDREGGRWTRCSEAKWHYRTRDHIGQRCNAWSLHHVSTEWGPLTFAPDLAGNEVGTI